MPSKIRRGGDDALFEGDWHHHPSSADEAPWHTWGKREACGGAVSLTIKVLHFEGCKPLVVWAIL